jgi:hypothetical protein
MLNWPLFFYIPLMITKKAYYLRPFVLREETGNLVSVEVIGRDWYQFFQ